MIIMGVPKLAHWDRASQTVGALSVTTAMLAADAVTSAKITDGTITYADVATNMKRFTVNIRNVADSGATDTWERAIFMAPFACTVISATIVSDSAFGQATNYATLTVANKTQSASIVGMDFTNANATTGYVGKSLGTVGNASLAANDVVTLAKTKTSAGQVVPAFMIQLVIERAA